MLYSKHDIDANNLEIRLNGQFDALGAKSIREDLEKLADDTSTSQHVVLNLEDVPFIDSSGIGAIVFLFKRLKVQQRNMRITGVTGQPAELFRMLRVHKAIPTDMRDENARGALA